MKKYYLYKYKAFNEYTINALLNDEIWYANPKEFNDIFDTNLFIEKAREIYPSKDLKNILDNSKLGKSKYKGSLILTLCSNVVILSLSKNCLKNTMWSHYADYHKGFCMEFEFDKKNGTAIYNSDINTYVLKVKYNSKYYIPHNLTNPEILYLQKSNEWIYEEEYRAVMSISKIELLSGSIVKVKNYCQLLKCEGYLDFIYKRMIIIEDLIKNNYYGSVNTKIKNIINEIDFNKVDKHLLKSMDNIIEDLNDSGHLMHYPGKLKSIIFGYRMPLENKLKIRNALSHLPNINYKKISQNGNDYRLSIVNETFIDYND